MFKWSEGPNPREFTGVCTLDLEMLLSFSGPKEPNPREFTRVCALELYLFGVSFVSFGVAVLARGA